MKKIANEIANMETLKEMADRINKAAETHSTEEVIIIIRLAEVYRGVKKKLITRSEGVKRQAEILKGAGHEV